MRLTVAVRSYRTVPCLLAVAAEFAFLSQLIALPITSTSTTAFRADLIPGNGSKAHLTLGCSPGVGAVTTGYDLVDLIRLEGINGSEVKTYDLPNGGWLRNYGDGQWVFYPTKQFLLESTFLGYESGTAGTCQIAASFSILCLSCAFAILTMLKREL